MKSMLVARVALWVSWFVVVAWTFVVATLAGCGGAKPEPRTVCEYARDAACTACRSLEAACPPGAP